MIAPHLLTLQEKADWETAKRVLGQPKFIERLLAYDADNVPDAVIEDLQRVVQDTRFTADQVNIVCKCFIGCTHDLNVEWLLCHCAKKHVKPYKGFCFGISTVHDPLWIDPCSLRDSPINTLVGLTKYFCQAHFKKFPVMLCAPPRETSLHMVTHAVDNSDT